MFGDIGVPELLVILVLAMVLFGPGKLPELGKALGAALRAFKKAMTARMQNLRAANVEGALTLAFAQVPLNPGSTV
jgi:TatA/E family protein of Tat protein translocase